MKHFLINTSKIELKREMYQLKKLQIDNFARKNTQLEHQYSSSPREI